MTGQLSGVMYLRTALRTIASVVSSLDAGGESRVVVDRDPELDATCDRRGYRVVGLKQRWNGAHDRFLGLEQPRPG